jgi:hypothetical protein
MHDDRKALVASLTFVYKMVVASAPLLRFAIERAEGDLLAYYKQHLEEESDHDEMLLDDLKRLGVEETPPNHVVAQITGSQYYLIAHEHPAMLLGYMHVLEHGTLRVADVDALSRKHGTELTALRHHAIHDPGHRKDLEVVIRGLDPDLRKRVEWNESWVQHLISQVRV